MDPKSPVLPGYDADIYIQDGEIEHLGRLCGDVNISTSKIAAASIPLPLIPSSIFSFKPTPMMIQIAFRPVHASDTTALNVNPESSLFSQLELFVRWLYNLQGNGPGGPDEAVAFLKEFLDAIARNRVAVTNRSGSEKTLAMRSAAAEAIQQRVDVQRSYAHRSDEHKLRMTMLEQLLKDVEAINPEEL